RRVRRQTRHGAGARGRATRDQRRQPRTFSPLMNVKPIPLVDEPMPRPQRWGQPELARLTAMVEQPSLFYWEGPQTTALLQEFRRHYPLRECFPTSSGSAAIHVAIAALRLQPGDEVIVPAIT